MNRKRVLLALSVLFNFLLPWAVYRLTLPHAGETRAIVASAAVPIVWSLGEFARNRKLDLISILGLSGVAVSVVVLALGGSPKVLLFRGSLVTGLVGLTLLGSAVIRRPLMLLLVRAAVGGRSGLDAVFSNEMLARAREELASYAGASWFARLMTVMTTVYGLILIAETAVLAVLVFSLPTERALLAYPIVRYGAAGLLMAWTFLYFVPAVRRGAAEDAVPS